MIKKQLYYFKWIKRLKKNLKNIPKMLSTFIFSSIYLVFFGCDVCIKYIKRNQVMNKDFRYKISEGNIFKK